MSSELTPAHPPTLEVEALGASYGRRRVLSDVSFAVEQGTILALLGRNGAGKSTTLMSIAGFVQRAEGAIRVDGRVLSGSPQRRAREALGLVAKGRSIFASLTVAENIQLGDVEAEEVLAMFPELRKRMLVKAGQLSGGEQQMLTVARALLRGPRVLMLDELTAGLSPAISDRLIDVVVSETAKRRMAVLVVEQHVHVAEKLATRALIMGDGRVQLSLDQHEFRTRASEIEHIYLGRPTP